MSETLERKFHAGQVVYSLRWLVYGLLEKRIAGKLPDGQIWDMVTRRGIPRRNNITVFEKELRPLSKKEAGK